MIANGLIRSHLNYTKTGLEYVTYAYNDRVNDLKFKSEFMPAISIIEFHLIRDILYEFMNYDDKRLTEMVYKTRLVRSQGVLVPGEFGAAGQILNFQDVIRLA